MRYRRGVALAGSARPRARLEREEVSVASTPALARTLTWATAVLALALVCRAGTPARADEKSDLLRKIEDLLEDAADALERLPGDSGTDALGNADRYVRDARSQADNLARVAGDDSTARRIAEGFRDTQDDWNDASGYLRLLKGGLKRHEQTVKLCADKDKELTAKAEAYRAADDPDGLTELPRLATAAREVVERELGELARHDDRLEDVVDDADDFRGDGPWGDLVSMVDRVADQMYGQWQRDLEQTRRSCEPVMRGPEHPVVRETLSRLGSSAGGRKAIIEQLRNDARALASALANVSEDSGMSSVERAKGLLDNLDRGLQNLARNATTDKETKLIIEKWPEGVRQLREAMDDLEDLKRHQRDMDPLPERCRQKEAELRDAVSRNGDDPDGIDELPKLAEALAAPVRAGMAKADERLRENESDLGRAKALSFSEAEWSAIRDAGQRDADETHRTFVDGHRKTTEACAEIMLGGNGKIVNEAVSRLRSRAAETGDSLDREVARWVEAARATYILDCRSMETLWQAYCGTDFEPGEDGEDERARQTAASLQSEMQGKMGPLLRELEALRPRILELIKKRQTKTRGESLLADVKKEEGRLSRLQDRGVWRGQNNPLTQYANRYGEERHQAEWSSHGCQVPTSSTGVAVFGSGEHTKPDCIIARSGKCEIIEFKPDSPEARRIGEQQLDAYERAVPTYYAQFVQKGEPDSAHGGREFMEAVRAHCTQAGVVRFGRRLVPYRMCDKQYTCE
jgi:hypothetical protein